MEDYGLEVSEQMEQVWGLFRNRFLYLGTTVNLSNVFHHKVFCVSFFIDEEKTYDENLWWKPFPFILDIIDWPF